jgi:hypothetical protein
MGPAWGGGSKGLQGSRGVRDEEIILGMSWYVYKPLITPVDRVYTPGRCWPGQVRAPWKLGSP